MKKSLTKKVCWLLKVALLLSQMPLTLRAKEDHHKLRPPVLRLYTTAPNPIGVIESFGTIKINGRAASGKSSLWGGELLDIPADLGARVSLKDTGHITLQGGTRVRIAVTREDMTEQPHSVLVATLSQGGMNVQLQATATAFLQSCGEAFTSSTGSNFRFNTREGRVSIETLTGTVRKESKLPWRRRIRRVTIRPDGTYQGASAQVNGEQGFVIPLRFQICEGDEVDPHDACLTPVDEKNAMEVAISLDPTELGTLSGGAGMSGANIQLQTDASGTVTAMLHINQQLDTEKVSKGWVHARLTDDEISVEVRLTRGSNGALIVSLFVLGVALGVFVGTQIDGNSSNTPEQTNNRP